MKNKLIQLVPFVCATALFIAAVLLKDCSYNESCVFYTLTNNMYFSVLRPFMVFGIYLITITAVATVLPKALFKSWLRFAYWFVPLALLFIFALPVSSTGLFLPSPWLQYFRADAARDAGRAFVLLSFVVVLWKFYRLRQVRNKK